MSGTRNLDGIKTQMLECIEAAYDKGYKSGLNDGNINDKTFAVKAKEAYGNGLNDAWECAKEIATDKGLNYDELEKIFNSQSMDVIFGTFSASEAIAKIKEYRDRQEKTNDEIHIGDEVYILDKNRKAVVTALLDDGEKVNLLCTSGNYSVVEISQLHKTGGVYVIAELLKSLSGEQRDD